MEIETSCLFAGIILDAKSKEQMLWGWLPSDTRG
jgi:hypothetical protein